MMSATLQKQSVIWRKTSFDDSVKKLKKKHQNVFILVLHLKLL